MEKDLEYWKDGFRSFYISLDPKLQDIVEDGYEALKDIAGVEISKKDFTVEQNKQYKMDHKAKTFMMNVITFKVFEKCSNNKTKKSIFNSLVLNYKGNKHVQEAKTNILVKKYDLFYMEEDKNIETMLFILQTLVSRLKVLQKSYTISDHVRKILKCLPNKWRPKLTTIKRLRI
ncbi:uncharacterized protein [Cicer arietinum]|uniref:uncharacterized protein n=1 Tax=Cicer arietinum TaxID=3827 RepID=UPI003CC63609